MLGVGTSRQLLPTAESSSARIVVSRFVFTGSFPGGGSSQGANLRNRRAKGG